MESFLYYSPVKILFEEGVRHNIGSLLRGKYKRVLLVLGKGPFRENGMYADLKKSIEAGKVHLFEMNDIESNPKMSSAREGVAICNANHIDCIIAMGGGSAIDCGKIIAAATKMGVDPYDLIWGKRLDVNDAIDLIAIPTLAATGTEVNNAAVMVNEETKEKYWALTKHPVYAIIDPELTVNIPLRLTLWGAMDILSHTFEYYFNGNNKSEFQLCFSEALITSIMTAVNQLVENPNNVHARGELMWCSIMAWGGLTKIGQGDPDMTCHSIEESFSGYFDTHHGACLGILTPNWMQMVHEKASFEFARFGRKVFSILGKNDKETAKIAVRKYIEWLKYIGAPQSYKDITTSGQVITKDELRLVAENAFSIYQGSIGKLIAFSLDDIIELLYAGLNPYSID